LESVSALLFVLFLTALGPWKLSRKNAFELHVPCSAVNLVYSPYADIYNTWGGSQDSQRNYVLISNVMKISDIRFYGCLLFVILLQGCEGNSVKNDFIKFSEAPEMLDLGERDYGSVEPIRPLPNINELVYSPQLVNLGNRLFHDVRLSGDQSRNCASCHDLNNGGDDGLRVSIGINNAEGSINAPTVLNSSFNFVQFWNGRAENLKAQAVEPVKNPVEMGGNWQDIVSVLTASGDYDQAFQNAYGDKTISVDRITEALGNFQTLLITPSPFDRYLRGESDAISPEAAHGYTLFKDFGCSACHQGINVGGNLFHKFGALHNFYDVETDADRGREAVTKNPNDLSVFKVPSLRNVALTAPYFHRGEVTELESAIRIMGLVQLNETLSDENIAYIAEFLRSLTGEKNLLDQMANATLEVKR